MKGPTRGAATATFLAAIAGIAAGIGVGWMLFAGERRQRDTVSEDVGAPTSESSTHAPRGGRAPSTAEKLDAAAESAVAAAAATPFDFSSLAGTGVIRGMVWSETGAPMSGVDIEAHAWTPWEWGFEEKNLRWDAVPIEDGLRRVARERRWREASTRRTRTAADGTFELPVLGDVRWEVDAIAEDFLFDVVAGTTNPARTGTTIEFRATPSIRFDADVKLPDGSRPLIAGVAWSNDDARGHSSEEWLPGRTQLRRFPGRWVITVTAEQDGRWFAAPPLELHVRRGMAPVVVTLKQRPGISIVARRPTGFADLGIRYYVARADDGEPTDDQLRKAVQSNGPWSDDRNSIHLDLEPGRWLAAAGVDGAPLARKIVTVADALVECGLDLPAPDPAQYVEIRVVGPTAESVPFDVELTWEYRTETESATYETTSFRRGDGVWRLRRVGPADRPSPSWRRGHRDAGGRWFVRAINPELGETEVEVPFGASSADVRFQPASFARIRLTGLPAAADARRLWVGVSRAGLETSLVEREFAADGSTRVGPLKPGSYEVQVEVREGAPRFVVTHLRAEFAAGEATFDVAVPPLHPLEIDLGALAAGDSCRLARIDESGDGTYDEVRVDATGRARFALVPQGRYCVEFDGKAHEFRVPQTRTFKLP